MGISRFALLAICLIISPVSSLAQARRATTSFDTAPFDSTTLKLPLNYIGHSLSAIAQILPLWKAATEKSEFETTADYQNRLSREKQKPLIGALHLNSLLAFSIGLDGANLTAKYDADMGLMTVTMEMWEEVLVGKYEDPCYSVFWSSTHRQTGSYIGRNFFNRPVRVQVYRDNVFYLGLCSSDLNAFTELRIQSDKYGFKIRDPKKSLNVAINMGANEARTVKPNLRALIIGRLRDDPIYYSEDRDEPTVSEPYDRYKQKSYVKLTPQEIWIYDISTGIIYAQVTPSPDNPVQPSKPTQPALVIAAEPSAAPKPIPPPAPRNPISVGVLNGKVISLPKPTYPRRARTARASGTVTVQVTIDESGKVISARAIGGHPLLQQAAVQAAYGALFTPTKVFDRPVKVSGIITYNFNAQ
jgi:TonB family protein